MKNLRYRNKIMLMLGMNWTVKGTYASYWTPYSLDNNNDTTAQTIDERIVFRKHRQLGRKANIWQNHVQFHHTDWDSIMITWICTCLNTNVKIVLKCTMEKDKDDETETKYICCCTNNRGSSHIQNTEFPRPHVVTMQ